MRLVTMLLFSLLAVSGYGQVAVYTYPSKSVIPVNGIQTFTAVVTGNHNKAVIWSNTCTSPTVYPGQYTTIGIKSATQQTCTVTATSIADPSKTASGTVRFGSTPTSMDGVHPRILLTPTLVTRMRTDGWAAATNPAWAKGLGQTYSNIKAEVDAKWCFGFGGTCTDASGNTTTVHSPLHVITDTMFNHPAISTLSRDGSGIVTVTTASTLDTYKGLVVKVTPARADLTNFPSGYKVVTSVVSSTSFKYAEAGAAATSTAAGTLSIPCGAYKGKSSTNTQLWCDAGEYKNSDGQTGLDNTEDYAAMFAYVSLVDPDPTESSQAAQRAHDMVMWAINWAETPNDLTTSTCTQVGTNPERFRSCGWINSDRCHQGGCEGFPETVDWVYSTFTAAEKITIRKFFRFETNQALLDGVTGGNGCVLYPSPPAVKNSSQLLSKPSCLRWQMNNLGDESFRGATMMSIVMDAADDPSDDGIAADWSAKITYTAPQKKGGEQVRPNITTNSLRAYSTLITGAWVYDKWAFTEDPAITSTALGVPATGLGEAYGGLTAESSEYGPNFGFNLEGLMALHTAGLDDPSTQPQMSMLQSSYWDLWVYGMMHFISPVPGVVDRQGSHYEISTFGDTGVGNVVSTDWWKMLTPLALYDMSTGANPARLNAARWFGKYAVDGGCGSGANGACSTDSKFLYSRMTTKYYNASYAMFQFWLEGDPAATANSTTNPSGDNDPRQAYPLEFYSPGIHFATSRTGWTAADSWLTTHCSWTYIDHDRPTCGQTEIWRKGRWLTKSHSTYTSIVGSLTSFADAGIEIGNPGGAPSTAEPYYSAALHGAEIPYSEKTSPVLESDGPGYFHELMDQTLFHNNTIASHYPTSDVRSASRSVFWIKPNILVYYDRGVSKTAGNFKNDNFVLTNTPTVTGRQVVSSDSVTGQQTILTTLLPLRANFSATYCLIGSTKGECNGSDSPRTARDWSRYVYQVTDTSTPLAGYFLHVMEGADSGVNSTPVALVRSTLGSNFDCAQINGGTNALVCFNQTPVTLGGTFSSTQVLAPISVSNFYLSGLNPNTSYGVTSSVSGGNTNLTVSASCSANCHTSDSSGLLALNVSAAQVITTMVNGGITGGGRPSGQYAGTLTVSSPEQGSTISGSVPISVSGTEATAFHLEILDNGGKLGNFFSSSVNISRSLPEGGHTMTVLAVANTGQVLNKNVVTFTVGTKSSSSGSLTVASPTNGSTSISAVRIAASASISNLHLLRISDNGFRLGDVYSDDVNGVYVLPNGSHVLTIQAIDNTGSVITSRSVNYQIAENCANSRYAQCDLEQMPADNSQNNCNPPLDSKWVANPCGGAVQGVNPTYPLSTDIQPVYEGGALAPQNNLTLNGHSMHFSEVQGTGHPSNVLFRGQSTSATPSGAIDSHWTLDEYVHLPNPAAHQAFEVDAQYTAGGIRTKFYTECALNMNNGTGFWGVFDSYTGGWIFLDGGTHNGQVTPRVPCNRSQFSQPWAGSSNPGFSGWHHIVWHFLRASNGTVTYQSITVDGTTNTINFHPNSGSGGGALDNGHFSALVQLDGVVNRDGTHNAVDAYVSEANLLHTP